MHLHKIVLALLFASLSGCGLNNLIKERQEAKEQAYITDAQASCKRYGFVEKTDAFAQCIQKEVNAKKEQEAADSRAQFNSLNSTTTSCTKTINGMDCITH